MRKNASLLILSTVPSGDLINGDIGIEANSGQDGKGEWSEMVQACVKEG